MAGQTSKTVTVKVIGDKNKEIDETFFVNLSSPSGATIIDNQGIGTLLNDDKPVARPRRIVGYTHNKLRFTTSL